LSVNDVVKTFMDHNKFPCANWYLIRNLSGIACLKYAIYAAKEVYELYNSKHPDIKHPRYAIRAARMSLSLDDHIVRDIAARASELAHEESHLVSNKAASLAAHAAAACANAAKTTDLTEIQDYTTATLTYAVDAVKANNMKKRFKFQEKMIAYGLKLVP